VTATFVVVPQWQGSPSSRAMRLADGASAIRSDLPNAATREIPVPLESGDAQGTGVARFSSLQLVRERLRDVLRVVTDTPIVIGGDCGVSSGAVAHAADRAARDGSELAVVWFDAHPDLNTPESSPSGAYGGMVLRSLIDEGVIPAARVVLAGERSWDDSEHAYATETGIRCLRVDELADAAALVDAVAATGARSVYVHIDLDVLDPAEIAGLLDPEPFGLAASTLVSTIKSLRARFTLAGATIASYAPASREDSVDDAPTILRIIGALAA
jgi:arginase